MIYVVEVSPEGKARAWFAFEGNDLARKVHASKQRQGWTIFAAASPRQLLEAHGHTPETPGAAEEHGGIFKLAVAHGWDAMLYRADYLLGQGVYQLASVAELDACLAAIEHDLKTCRIYLSDAEAAAELYRDPLYEGREGFLAHMALREQLIAMEVIADDL
jgi:hypothetical protein